MILDGMFSFALSKHLALSTGEDKILAKGSLLVPGKQHGAKLRMVI